MFRCNDRDWYEKQLDMYDINIWVIEFPKLAYALDFYWRTLSTDEKERVLLFKTENLKIKYIIARGVLRDLLSLYLNIPAPDVIFSYNSHGKPKIDNNSVFFNLSHSKNLALIVFSKAAEVGVDVEFVDSSVDIMSLSSLVMTTEEQAMFNAITEEKKVELFYTNFTRKEAFVKGVGLGLEFDLKNCFVGLKDLPQLMIQNTSNVRDGDWSLYDIHLKNRFYKAAVALEKGAIFNAQYLLTNYADKYVQFKYL